LRKPKTTRKSFGKSSCQSDPATSQIIHARRQSKPENLYSGSKSQVLPGANTIQIGNYSQNLFAGHLPSDEIAIAETMAVFHPARVK
jgi:hypothetical protein